MSQRHNHKFIINITNVDVIKQECKRMHAYEMVWMREARQILSEYFEDDKAVNKLLQRILFARLSQSLELIDDVLFPSCTSRKPLYVNGEHTPPRISDEFGVDFSNDPVCELLTHDFMYANKPEDEAKELSMVICDRLQSVLLKAQHHVETYDCENSSGVGLKEEHFCLKHGIVWWELKSLKIPVMSVESKTHIKIIEINEFLLASSLRYHYMEMHTMGLAFDYQSIGYKRTDSVCEAFASNINHYFDVWCSAFPDVDVDSVGNFFHLEAISQQVLVVNPPYDVLVCEAAIDHCLHLIVKCLNITVMFILPDWSNWQALDKLKQDSYKVQTIKKQSAAFIDYSTNKIIHPCNVVCCWIGKNRAINKDGKVQFDSS